MEQHAGHCESCAALMAGYRALDQAIAARKAIAPKPFAATRILQAIENREHSRSRTAVTVLRPVLITLALLVALMAGFLIGNAGYSRIAAPESPDSASVESLKSVCFRTRACCPEGTFDNSPVASALGTLAPLRELVPKGRLIEWIRH